MSGVVAACSWGKRVAIGTGGQFQIMWDKKKVTSSPHRRCSSTHVNIFHFLRRDLDRERGGGGMLTSTGFWSDGGGRRR